MTGTGVAVTAAGVVGGAGSVVAVLASPLPLLVLGGLALAVWLPLAVLLLTPVFSSDPDRCARAREMVDRVLATVTATRPVTDPGAAAPAAVPPKPATRRPRRRRRSRGSARAT